MSVREAVLSQMREIAGERAGSVPKFTDDLVLLDSGLDSLGIAILVARLEETLGFDPFTDSEDVFFPVTIGDLIRFYEDAAARRAVDSRQAG